MTPREEKFARLYLETGCASASALSCDINLSGECPKDGCYVYFLLCPRRERIVYVGKGTGNRMHHHLRDVRNGVITGAKKFIALQAMVNEGQEPVAVVYQAGLTSYNALKVERALIHRIGVDRLFNAHAGQITQIDLALAQLERARVRRKPFCRWLKEFQPLPEQFGFYAQHALDMKRLAHGVANASVA